MKYYVLRHIPTGQLLSARARATHWDFDGTGAHREPRLFSTERAAKNCASCWAQGTWVQETFTESEGWEYPSYTCRDLPRPKAAPGRRREDIEVVPVVLTGLGELGA